MTKVIPETDLPSRQAGANFRVSLPMPDEWHGAIDALALPEGLTKAMVREAGEILRAWEESDEPSTAPVAVMLYELFRKRHLEGSGR